MMINFFEFKRAFARHCPNALLPRESLCEDIPPTGELIGKGAFGQWCEYAIKKEAIKH